MAPEERQPTSTEAQLQQERQGVEGDRESALKETARDERKQQRAELAGGKKGEGGKLAKGSPAQQRTLDKDAKPVGATVDNMTQRDAADPLVGHFCLIDYSVGNAKQVVQAQLAPKGSALAEQGFEPGLGSADYGVILDTGAAGPDGYPTSAIVRLRDEHAANVNVPWEALRRAPAGGRR